MSWQMKAAGPYLTVTRQRRARSVATAEAVLRQPKPPATPPSKLTRSCTVERRRIDGFTVYVVTPREAPRDDARVVYLHGGGFVSEIQKPHWKLIAELATHTRCPVWVPIYGLAPAHHADEALAFVLTVFDEVSRLGDTYLAGDSAGGGLAVSATMAWSARGGTPPRGLTLMAPWLDIGLRDPRIAEVQRSDPWLSITGLRVYGRSWANGIASDDPSVSPLFGDVEDLPPTELYIGTRDITMPDCRTLRDKMPPGRMRYHELRGGLHVYPLLPTPEGKRARREIVAHVESVLSA